MDRKLPFGESATLELELPEQALVTDCGAAQGEPLDDPRAAVAAALAAPLDLPPLRLAVTPGDRVALAVDRDVPRLPEVIAAAVGALLEGSVEPKDIALIVADPEDCAEGRLATSALSESMQGDIAVTVHSPGDPADLCYLAASEQEALPIYLNRRLIEADFVLPIGALRLEDALGYLGACGSLFPAFADAKTQERFFAPSSAEWAELHDRRRREAEEAAWLLGVQYMLQVTPGPRQSLLGALCGSPAAVAERGRQLSEAVWRCPIPGRASLVVAAIDGGPHEQTWQNVGRALLAASQAVAEGGAIVLCTELSEAPGQALKTLAAGEGRERADREIHRLRTPDALPAAMLARLLDHCRVYLYSKLDNDEVEDLGMAPVDNLAAISRLSRQHPSCVLLASAQYAMPVAGREEPPAQSKSGLKARKRELRARSPDRK